MKFKAEEFMATEIFSSYSSFSQKVFEYFNEKLENDETIKKYSISYFINPRNDNKVTFCAPMNNRKNRKNSKKHRNLVTLTPNKSLNYMREAEVRLNGAHKKRIDSLNDIDKIFKYTKALLTELYENCLLK